MCSAEGAFEHARGEREPCVQSDSVRGWQCGSMTLYGRGSFQSNSIISVSGKRIIVAPRKPFILGHFIARYLVARYLNTFIVPFCLMNFLKKPPWANSFSYIDYCNGTLVWSQKAARSCDRTLTNARHNFIYYAFKKWLICRLHTRQKCARHLINIFFHLYNFSNLFL